MSKTDPSTLSKIVELGCCVCRKIGYPGTPAELHIFSIKQSKNSTKRVEVVLTVCPPQHRGETGIHGLGKRKFEKSYGFTISELLEDTNNLLKES
jgi:hypothetical protein